MKKEYIYIFIMVIFFASSYYYVNILIKDKITETEKIVENVEDLYAKFRRDSIIQSGISNIKLAYLENKLNKSDRFDNIVVENSYKIEKILNELKISYNPNNIGFSKEEMKQGALSYYEINLSFTAKFEKVIKFLNIIENSKNFNNILELDISKDNSANPDDLGSSRGFDLSASKGKNDESSQLGPKLLSVDIKVQFIKFL